MEAGAGEMRLRGRDGGAFFCCRGGSCVKVGERSGWRLVPLLVEDEDAMFDRGMLKMKQIMWNDVVEGVGEGIRKEHYYQIPLAGSRDIADAQTSTMGHCGADLWSLLQV